MRAAVEPAARDFEAAGAMSSLWPFLTQEMLDGTRPFWRMRSLIDIGGSRRTEREKILPFIRAWAESAARFSAERVSRLQPDHGDGQGGGGGDAPFDFILSPTAPMTAFAAEWPLPSHDPSTPSRISALPSPSICPNSPRRRSIAATTRRPADRTADRRAAIRRRGGSVGGARL